jgi:hypothetical protein
MAKLLVGPLSCAIYLAFAMRQGGARRLLRDTLVLVLLMTALVAWLPDVVMPRAGGQLVAGARTWPFFPIAVLGSAAVVWLLSHPRVPLVARVIPSAICASVLAGLGGWIA